MTELVPAATRPNNKKEYCSTCGQTRVGYSPDPCLGRYIEGVAHACCGHGDIDKAYCCGWAGCSPNEYANGGDHPGWWRFDGQQAIDFFRKKGASL